MGARDPASEDGGSSGSVAAFGRTEVQRSRQRAGVAGRLGGAGTCPGRLVEPYAPDQPVRCRGLRDRRARPGARSRAARVGPWVSGASAGPASRPTPRGQCFQSDVAGAGCPAPSFLKGSMISPRSTGSRVLSEHRGEARAGATVLGEHPTSRSPRLLVYLKVRRRLLVVSSDGDLSVIAAVPRRAGRSPQRSTRTMRFGGRGWPKKLGCPGPGRPAAHGSGPAARSTRVGWRTKGEATPDSDRGTPATRSDGSRPGEDVGGQVGHAQLRLPRGRLLGLAPGLVQPDHPLGRLAQAGRLPARRSAPRAAFIPS